MGNEFYSYPLTALPLYERCSGARMAVLSRAAGGLFRSDGILDGLGKGGLNDAFDGTIF